jgi:serine/threonine-protein kinase
VLFTSPGAAAAKTEPWIYVQSLTGGEPRPIIQGIGAYFDNGHLVVGRGNSVFAVPFNLDRLEAVGTPELLIDRIFANRAPQVTVSGTGSLAYVATFGWPDSTLAWVNRNGAEQLVPLAARAYHQPRLSPDGNRLAVAADRIRGGAGSDLWTFDFAREALALITSNGSFPTWTPDGQRLAFSAPGLLWKASDGSGPEDVLLDNGLPLSWSPDGRTLSMVRVNSATQQDIWMLPVDALRKPQTPYPFLQSRFAEGGQVFSPDGRFVAYVSAESGRNQVYVRPFRDTGGRWQVSSDGGNEVTWPRKGRELFYRNGRAILAVDVTTTPNFAAGKPRRLFEGPYVASTALWSNYDVAPDGQRFLMIKPVRPSETRPQVINVLLNWPATLGGQRGEGR